MKKGLIFIALFTATVLFTQCTKTGPAGPAGPAGPQGASGATGPLNNANVQTIVFTNVTFSLGDTTFSIPAITQQILDSGVVLASVRNTGTTLWYPMPYILGTTDISLFTETLGQATVRSTYAGRGVDFKFDIIAGQ